MVKKINKGVPNVLDVIRSGTIDIVVNTPNKGNNSVSDGFQMRRVSAETNTNLMTSLDTLAAMIDVMESESITETVQVLSLQGIK